LSTLEQYYYDLYVVKLTASFAVDLDYFPSQWLTPYRDRQPYIIAQNHDQLAWYCWTPGNTILKVPYGGYFVPTWDFGAISNGQSVSRTLNFTVSGTGLPPEDSRHIVIEESALGQDMFLNRTKSLKVSDWIDNCFLDTGGSYPSGGKSSDVSVFSHMGPGEYRDWGDAPDSLPLSQYPTFAINRGANHIIVEGFCLGTVVDGEADGQPDGNATGDDNNPPAGTDDEDGVVFNPPLSPGQPATMTVTLTDVAGTGGFLDAWTDFNADGDWSDSGEQIFTAQPLVPLPLTNVLNFTVPVTATPGTITFARCRLSSFGNLSPTGMAVDGEVEDYQVWIDYPPTQQYDWGDAPDGPYPTWNANSGANHQIVTGFFLGASVDAEQDGQPNSTATGDDINPPAGPDDEDGVTFLTLLLPGGTANISVVASAPGKLDAWVDFNNDGSWAGDRIFNGTPLVAGANTLSFPVPATAVPGTTTFARFRLSNAGGLGFVGGASDGEVEDYEVKIGFKWIQEPDLSTTGMDVNATKSNILADDFRCKVTGLITDIHLWGSWYHDELPEEGPAAVKFRLSIHEDIPDPDGSGPLYSMPGPPVWMHEFQPDQFYARPYMEQLDEGWFEPPSNYEQHGDTICWEYDFDISQFPFVQRGSEEYPKVYWLDVQAEPMDGLTYFGWKTSLNHWNDDAVYGMGNEPYPGPWYELRYPLLHPMAGQSIDLAFAITGRMQPPTLTIAENLTIRDHFWWQGGVADNVMASLLVSADQMENVVLNSIDFQAGGSGNDQTDITLVKVWLDNAPQGFDPGDTPLGSGFYGSDNGAVTINLVPAQVIPVNGSTPLLVTYTMGPAAAPPSAYLFTVAGASGAGQSTGLAAIVNITPTPLASSTKYIGVAPITIGASKLLPASATFLLNEKEVTANFTAGGTPSWPTPWQWIYIEEEDRSAGIGVIVPLTGGSPVAVGDKVSVIGANTLWNSYELMVQPSNILTYHVSPTISALGMVNKATGGGPFGRQPAVLDDDPTGRYAVGLSNVGMLERAWGLVTGYGGVSLDPMPGGINYVDVFWMDDGSLLADGYTTSIPGGLSCGIAVVNRNSSFQPTGYWGVTGILRVIHNPNGLPIRLLAPRDWATDTLNYPMPP
jgi:hypothetical protein